MQDRSNQARGAWGERRAVAHLRRLGFDIVAVDWRSPEPGVRGDLDVIARRGDLVVVCEVKARRSSFHGTAACAVDDVKQQRIRLLTASWLRTSGSGADIRFDVISIDGTVLTHHEQAF